MMVFLMYAFHKIVTSEAATSMPLFIQRNVVIPIHLKLLFKRAVAALLLCTVLLCAPPGIADNAISIQDTTPVPLIEMPFDPDLTVEPFLSELSLWRTMGLVPGNEEAIAARYIPLMQDLIYIENQAVLANWHYYKDPFDEETIAIQASLQEKARQAEDAFLATASALLSGYAGEALTEAMGQWEADVTHPYVPLDDASRQWMVEEAELMQTYSSLAAQEEDAAELVALFQALVSLRTSAANRAGYASYVDYVSELAFARDYDNEDTVRLTEYVKTYIAPLYRQMEAQYPAEYRALLEGLVFETPEDALPLIRQYMEALSSWMTVSMDTMLEYQLYDLAPAKEKAATSFTQRLPYYQTAMIFYGFEGPYYQHEVLRDILHECGHFHFFNTLVSPPLYTSFYTDLLEVHAHGLEMLFLEYYDDLFGPEAAEAATYDLIYVTLRNITVYSALHEFETFAYSNPNATARELNEAYCRIAASYGKVYPEGVTGDMGWAYKGILFASPAYDISYAAAGLAALDIYMRQEESREDALSVYLHIVAYSEYLPFCQALEYSGASDIFTEDFFLRLTKALSKFKE